MGFISRQWEQNVPRWAALSPRPSPKFPQWTSSVASALFLWPDRGLPDTTPGTGDYPWACGAQGYGVLHPSTSAILWKWGQPAAQPLGQGPTKEKRAPHPRPYRARLGMYVLQYLSR